MSAIFGCKGDAGFAAQLQAALPAQTSSLDLTPPAGAASSRIGLAQPATFFPLGQPVELAGGRGVAALRGYAWGSDGFPRDERAARALVESMAVELIETGRLRVDGRHLSGVFCLVVVTEDSVLAASDPSGTYPVYIHRRPGQVAVASQSRPLAQATGAGVDLQSLVQLAGFGYCIGQRSVFDGVSCAPAGAAVTLEATRGTVRIQAQQVSYCGLDHYRSRNEAADALWADYRSGMAQLNKSPGCAGLFVSGGFDSRLVAVGFAHAGRELTTLTLGDDDNFEVTKAHRVANLAKARWRRRSPVAYLDSLAERVGELVAHAESACWVQCDGGGRELVEDGATTLSTGVGGETFLGGLGGRFYVGVHSRRDRALALLDPRAAPGAEGVTARSVAVMADGIVADHEGVLEQLARRVTPAMDSAIAQVRAGLPDEVRAELARIVASEPATLRQVAERFEMEHDVIKEHGRRELTLDMHAPVVLPLYDTAMLLRASNMDPRLKDDHRTYIRMARRHWGEFAKIPTSVIPISLRSPEPLIWASRAARVSWDKRQVAIQKRTMGARGRRIGWTNYERWARESTLLDDLPGLIDDRIISAKWLEQKLDKQRRWVEKFHEGMEYLRYTTASAMVSGLEL